jgi:hypothetical protein
MGSLFSVTDIGFKNISDVGPTIQSADGARPKRWSMDLWVSVGFKPRILESSGAMEDALLLGLWPNVGCPSNGATPTGTIWLPG